MCIEVSTSTIASSLQQRQQQKQAKEDFIETTSITAASSSRSSDIIPEVDEPIIDVQIPSVPEEELYVYNATTTLSKATVTATATAITLLPRVTVFHIEREEGNIIVPEEFSTSLYALNQSSLSFSPTSITMF
mmetsp:Transcript_1525/g.1628  ORF Transcript_1525/g.1628 Transcript_1525/m.1628 type:complete len:133 (+) Transcript_1525:309-707(+)